MGIAVELFILLMFAVLGQSIFARFEIETPPARKIVKWFTIIGVTLGLYQAIGHWALVVPVGIGVAGTTFHFIWFSSQGFQVMCAVGVEELTVALRRERPQLVVTDLRARDLIERAEPARHSVRRPLTPP